MDKVSDRQGCLKDQVRTRQVRQSCVDRKLLFVSWSIVVVESLYTQDRDAYFYYIDESD
jgi:hypothetical protein